MLDAGIVLTIHGVNAMNSASCSLSRFFTGAPTDRAMWMLLGGIAMLVAGLAVMLPGFRKKTKGAGNMKTTVLKDVSKAHPTLSDIQTLRKRARQHIEQGAVTSGYAAERDTVIKLLNEALATEIVCVLRYKRHYFMAAGIHAAPVAAEFLEHATEEMQHADSLAKRIVELRGEPNFSPVGLSERSHAEYVEGASLNEMIKEDLIAERVAIESYREMIEYLGDKDPTTQRLLKTILASEEEHAEDLSSLLQGMAD